MRLRLPFASLSMIAMLAACTRSDPVADNADGGALPAPANFSAPAPAGAPPDDAAKKPTAQPAGAAVTIPLALQGRWGLTPGDCTSTRGDAKGLLTISANELSFYESRAVPGAGVEAHADRISGNFNFTGEGQSWTKFQTLRATDTKLVRTETDPAASFAYAKC
jgi:hypothetical protein